MDQNIIRVDYQNQNNNQLINQQHICYLKPIVCKLLFYINSSKIQPGNISFLPDENLFQFIYTLSLQMDPVSLKLVIVGDGVVGKTCILSTYAHNSFPAEYVPTIFDNTTLSIKIDGTIVTLSLWDTAGQQQYERLRPLAYPSADIFLIIFSVDSPASFINAKKKWYKEVSQANRLAIKIFVGNKIDLRDDKNNENYIQKQSARMVIQYVVHQLGLALQNYSKVLFVKPSILEEDWMIQSQETKSPVKKEIPMFAANSSDLYKHQTSNSSFQVILKEVQESFVDRKQQMEGIIKLI